NANLDGADLRECNLRVVKARSASFKGADLRGADASHGQFQKADLSGAKLDGVKWDRAEYDEATVWPAKFTPPRDLVWKGQGPDPRLTTPPAAAVAAAPAPALTVEEFLERLPTLVDPSRLGNAKQMLKTERFQLFSQVEQDKLLGVVRSQSSEDRVYACKLASD